MLLLTSRSGTNHRFFARRNTMPNLNSNRVLKHPGSPKSDERLFESKVNVPEGNRRALIHLLYDSIAEHVEEAVDLVAERVTALGGRANGTARQVAANSSIKEYDLNVM